MEKTISDKALQELDEEIIEFVEAVQPDTSIMAAVEDFKRNYNMAGFDIPDNVITQEFLDELGRQHKERAEDIAAFRSSYFKSVMSQFGEDGDE